MEGSALDALRIQHEPGPPPRLRVAGEIDLVTAGELVSAASTAASGDLVLDLSGVTYFDSSGVRALMELKQRYGERLAVVGNTSVRMILDILGLSDEFRWV